MKVSGNEMFWNWYLTAHKEGLGYESFKLDFRLAPFFVLVSVLLKTLLWGTDVCAR